MVWLRDLYLDLVEGQLVFRIGEQDLSYLPVLQQGPIIECLTPGCKNPAYVAWIPVMFEGTVTDPKSMARIVHEGEAEAVGLPDVEGGENGDT